MFRCRAIVAFCALISIAVQALPADDKDNTKYITDKDLGLFGKCKQNDEKIGECLKGVFNTLWERYKHGNPELGIVPYDPFSMNRTTFQYTNGPVSGRITTRNAKIYGLGDAKLTNMEIKFSNDSFKARLTSYCPKMIIAGTYKADMTFNNVHVKPKGEFNVTLIDINTISRAEGVFYEKDGHRFIKMIDYDADPKIGDLKVKANGIFPDPELDQVVLGVANEYWRDVYKVMLPETRRYWQPLIVQVCNEAFKSFPIDSYLQN